MAFEQKLLCMKKSKMQISESEGQGAKLCTSGQSEVQKQSACMQILVGKLLYAIVPISIFHELKARMQIKIFKVQSSARSPLRAEFPCSISRL